jgi:UDP-N-acetylmuramoyl-tripeptide--D-alanyl-D-alanine ligase
MITIPELYELYMSHPVVSTDTRSLPKGGIFFALKGPNFNGNLYAKQALDGGAAYAVVDEDAGNDPRILRTTDVLTTLQELANYHRHRLDIHVLAITGSNGKTTTKELCAAVLSKTFELHYTKGNLNNHIGVPLTLLQLTEDHDFAVVEMGANHQGEIADLCRIAEPDYGMITNIGDAHLEGFGGREGVKKGKGEMYHHLKANGGLVFIQLDNSILHDILHGYDDIVSYGTGPLVQYRGQIRPNNSGFLHVEVTHPYHTVIRTRLTGDYNFDNVMCAVAVGGYFGVEQHDVQAAIEAYIPDNQRSQVIQSEQFTIILDAYNANPTSMEAAIDNFSKHFNGPKIMALGEMLELGEASAEAHRRILEQANRVQAEKLLLVGESFRTAERKDGTHWFASSEACADWLRLNKPAQGSILIKGSRGSRMERVLDALN